MGDWLTTAVRQYDRADLTSAEAMAEARLMLCQQVGMPFASALTETNRVLTDNDVHQLNQWITQRLETRLPIQYVLGEAWFCGLRLEVTPDVLIPRPETEVLAAWAVEHCQTIVNAAPLNIADIGTGSGAIACAIKHGLGDRVWVMATDISPAALSVARLNADRLGLAVTFQLGDGLDALSRSEANPSFYDLIVSNPPYIPEADWKTLSTEVQAEPRLALTAGEDGLSVIRRLLADGQRFLNPGGYLAMELEYRQWPVVAKRAESLDWQVLPPVLDLEGRERFILVRSKIQT